MVNNSATHNILLGSLVSLEDNRPDVADSTTLRKSTDDQYDSQVGTSSYVDPMVHVCHQKGSNDESIFHLPTDLLVDQYQPPVDDFLQPDSADSGEISSPLTPAKLDPLAVSFIPGEAYHPLTPATPSKVHSAVVPSRPARISVKSIINNLLSVKAGKDPMFAFVTTASVCNSCGPAQEEHLETNEFGRVVLRKDSQLRLRGVALGLPKVYVEWLCGNGGETLTIPMSTLFERKCALSRQ
jgi:hypothetical protein